MYEWLAWLTLLLLAAWFFGNLYEAVALVPNLLSLLELKSLRGEPLFKTKAASPAMYYLPPGLLGLVLTVVLAVRALVHHYPGTCYIVATSVGVLTAGGLTAYIVIRINLDLFFKPQRNLARTRKMIDVWTTLNYVRLALGGISLVTAILWIRTVLKP